ncbi:hypothetical protein GWK47_003104 [Chionoecetes opilio]|uniref:Helix-turn-helix domain-containing protein n=1 Tax=Chionoecetes opilio TaxID=41210 RepID=A0A8J8WDP4_CHIOP|nr:hypothetical protein GWK47_003104 [Chionoecetes opilio]
MPFLDFLVTQKEESFITNVYVKPTNPGHCLNGESKCPQRYKDSTIGAYIRRALTHCSTWQLVHKEIERSTQVLINNGFSERDINRNISRRKIQNGRHCADVRRLPILEARYIRINHQANDPTSSTKHGTKEQKQITAYSQRSKARSQQPKASPTHVVREAKPITAPPLGCVASRLSS